ncbi:MAG: serine hydrolase domain-containing protein [Bacilli bacterium]
MLNLKKIWIAVSIVVVCFASWTVWAFRSSVVNQAKNMDEFLTEQGKRGNIPNANVIVTDSAKNVVEKTLQNGQVVAYEPNDAYGVGSISKSVTALAIRQLINEGMLKESELYRTYVPTFKVGTTGAENEITIAHLLRFESGIDRASVNVSANDWPSFLTSLDNASLDRNVGEARYPSVDYILLSYLIEQLSGMHFEDYVTTHIFKPLGMTQSTFSGNPAVVPPNKSLLHTLAPDPTESYGTVTAAEGRLVSTATDMGKYVRAILNGGGYEGGQITHAPRSSGHVYDLFWNEVNNEDLPELSFTGAPSGYLTTITIDYRKQIASVALTNKSNQIPNVPTVTSLSIATGALYFNESSVSQQATLGMGQVYGIIGAIIAVVILSFISLVTVVVRWFKSRK